MLIISVSDNLDQYDLSDAEGNQDKKKSGPSNELLKPLSEKKTKKISEVKIDLDEIDPSTLADEIIAVQITEDGKRNAKNSQNYAKRQVKTAVTSFDNILKNLDNADKSGLKSLVNKAISRLEKIRDRL